MANTTYSLYENQLITLQATPNDGYRFVRWNTGDTENPLTIKVSASATYQAIFEKESNISDNTSIGGTTSSNIDASSNTSSNIDASSNTTSSIGEDSMDNIDDTQSVTNCLKFTTKLSSVTMQIEDDIDTDDNRTALFGASMSPNIQYSHNGTSWTTWDCTSLIEFGNGNPLYLRGKNPNGLATGALSFTRLHLSSTTPNDVWSTHDWNLYDESNGVKCTGDLMSLIDYTGATTLIPENAFTELFLKEHSLISAPGCTGTNFASACFMKTFCQTSISETPVFASEGAIDQYSLSGMFQDCKGLTKISGINFKGTVYSCGCEGVFQNCTALENVDENLLSEITWAGTGAFLCMFDGCTSLKKAPIIPAMTFRETAFDDMFRKCSSLVYLKALPDSGIGVTREFYELHDPYETDTVYSYGQDGVLIVSDDNKNTIMLPDTWTKYTVSEYDNIV